MDEQELQRLLQTLTEEIRLLGAVSAESAQRLRELSGGPKVLDVALKTLLKTTVAYTKEMYRGKEGATAFNSSMDAMTQGFQSLLKQIPIVGDTLAEMAGAANEATKEINIMSDRLYESYQTLSRVGISAADGMMGLAESAQALGYGLETMDDFIRLMQNASQTLAAMSGSAAEGRKRFEEIARIVRSEAGRELRNLGMTVPEINETVADFVKMQTRLGISQTRSNTDLRNSAVSFSKELDILAKLTGEQKDRLRDQMNAALNEQRFRARLEILRRKGEFDTIENVQKLQSAVATAAPGLSEGLRDIIAANGAITSTAAEQAYLATGGRIQAIARRALAGEDFVGLFNDLAGAVGKGSEKFLEISAYADLKDVYGDLAKNLDLANRYIDTEGKLRDKLTGEIIKQEKGADGVVGTQTDLRISQNNARDSLQTFVKLGVNPATRALQKLAKLPEAATGVLPGEVPGGAIPGGGAAPGTGAAGLRGAAAKNLNPGNLRFAGQRGATMGTGGFAKFESVDQGLVALANQLNLYLTGRSAMGQLDTIQSLISTYAPPNENDSKAYIKKVAQFMGIDPNQKLSSDPTTMAKLMTAIIGIENHGDPNKGYNFRSGVQFAVAQALGIDPSKIGKFADGGIARGPNSGYPAVLHGAEAVVPLPDGKTIPVEIKGLGSSELVTQLLTYLAKANRMYLETIPVSKGGLALEAVTTSPEYMAGVMQLYDMAATRAAEAQIRGIDYVQQLKINRTMSNDQLMEQLADGGITRGPSIAGEAGPEAVVPLPDGRTIPVEMAGIGEMIGALAELASLQRANNSVMERLLQVQAN